MSLKPWWRFLHAVKMGANKATTPKVIPTGSAPIANAGSYAMKICVDDIVVMRGSQAAKNGSRLISALCAAAPP